MKKRPSKKTTQSLITIEKSAFNYALLLLLGFVLLIAAVSLAYAGYVRYDNVRLVTRATDIHSSLQLDDSYWKVTNDTTRDAAAVSRVSKSTPLVMEYGRVDGVESTLIDLENHLDLAGFTELAPANTRGLITHNTYGNDEGDRINVQIRPKQVQDTFMYGVTPQVDKDAGVGDGSPVYIVIGVYFDKARG